MTITSPSLIDPVVLPSTRLLRMEADGRRYRIRIAQPPQPAPPAGYPVLYLLDGNSCFATVAETRRRLSQRSDATGVQPAVIVGIAHDADGAEEQVLRQKSYAPSAHISGEENREVEAMFAFIDGPLKTRIREELPIDATRQALAGHSLAAHFVLYVLLKHTAAFASYAAISPSVWCNPNLIESVAAMQGTARVFIAAGEWEEDLAPWQHSIPGAAEMLARRRERCMIGNAREFAERLASRIGPEYVQFHLFPDEDHASVFAVAISRAMRMLP